MRYWLSAASSPLLAWVAGSVLITALLPGCGGRSLELEARWRPLLEVKEAPFAPEGGAVTIGRTVYVQDLDELKAKEPVRFDALMLHEQYHARSQKRVGLLKYSALYGTSAEFMAEEELPAWALQLEHLRGHGQAVDVLSVARSLSGYKTVIGNHRMISLGDAERFVRDVLSGRWGNQ